MVKYNARKKSSTWAFTDFGQDGVFHNWEEEFLDENNYQGIGYGKEKCPKTGRWHLQGHFQLKTSKRWSTVKNSIPKWIHIEPCKGTVAQNIKYCSKGGDYRQFGNFIVAGQKRKLADMAQHIVDHPEEKFDDMMLDNPELSVRHGKGLKRLKTIVDRKTTPSYQPVEVIYVWGEPRLGKTRWAEWVGGNDFFKLPAARLEDGWFDGYDGQSVLIIDDYAGNAKCTFMKHLLDNYTMDLKVKGGFVRSKWSMVIITSNHDFDDLHEKAKPIDKKAIKARIDWIWNMDYKWSPPTDSNTSPEQRLVYSKSRNGGPEVPD